MLKAILDKPHYVFRPAQALRRMRQKLSPPPQLNEFHETTLPWGLRLRFRPKDHIGQFLYHNGLYDLCVSETLYRLAAPGETAVDVGGNIGQMTSILAIRAGRGAKVHTFEPHPEIFEELSANIALWRSNGRAAEVVAHRIALSDTAGIGQLQMTSEFEHNRGTSSLAGNGSGKTHAVTLARLDAVLSPSERVGVMKLDVEGHELGVLKGATALLQAGAIRDLIFEDYGTPPTPVMSLLESFGYRLFSVRNTFFGLDVAPVTTEILQTSHGPPSYLATKDPERALSRLGRKGWAVFGLMRI
jgi:FkbM family methyltransferase